MRGIERVLAAILLIAAVGGAAVFARESGNGLAEAVHLAAPPQQHLAAPGTVLIAPTASADHSQRILRLPEARQFTSRPATSAKGRALPPVVIALNKPQPPAQAPAATPTPVPVATPAPAAPPVETVAAPPAQPAPPRVVASAQPEPVPAPAPAPAAPIKATPLPPVTVTSANVHGLNPAPGQNGNDDSQGDEPGQGMHVKGSDHPAGD